MGDGCSGGLPARSRGKGDADCRRAVASRKGVAAANVIKIAIQILKSYYFTIQNMVDYSIRDSRQFYTFLLTSENLASLNHANKKIRAIYC